MTIYVSNLGDKITEESLDAIFSTYGSVASCRIVLDGFTGYSRGFAFIDMPDEDEAAAAISRINGSVVNGTEIHAEQARQEPQHRGSYAIGRRARK
jgi:RNA recognition motif-containing protein